MPIESYEDILGRQKKPRKNSRLKGAENERKLAKHMEAWTGKEFARVPSSGGLRWREGQNICGDLICTDPHFPFPFSLETKHYEKGKITQTYSDELLKVLKPSCKLYKVFEQAFTDAARDRKLPLILLKDGSMRGWHVWMLSLPHMPPILNVHVDQVRFDMVGIRFNLMCVSSEVLFAIPYKDIQQWIDQHVLSFRSIFPTEG